MYRYSKIGLGIILIVFFVGVGFLLYPVVSNYLYQEQQSIVRTEYETTIEQEEREWIQEEWEQAKQYNQQMLDGTVTLTDPFDPDLVSDSQSDSYTKLLSMDEEGLMGYIEIPVIDVNLPIYHGTSSDVLENGIGHMQQSSLPTGGDSTHAVLTGHTGLAGKKMFTDLADLQKKDVFYLYVLDQVLAYEVYQIKIVEPKQVDLLRIEEEKDLVTLVTCYPYGINSHRLLIQGTRIPYEETKTIQERIDNQERKRESSWEKEYRKAILICIAIYVPFTLVVINGIAVLEKRR